MAPHPLRCAAQWHAALGPGLLAPLYGPGSPAVGRVLARLRRLLERFTERFGDGPLLLARAPGRLNVMGRHVDHQGGHVNTIALDRDVWLAVAPQDERAVALANTDPAFPDRAFALDDAACARPGSAWLDFVDSGAVRARAEQARGDWAQYVRAAAERVRAEWPDALLPGLRIAVDGDIPAAAGLSSSSALVVAAMEALVALLGLEVAPERFVELCGEAEWYVGTRGGAGDHAAMKLARAGQVVQVGFYPFGATGAAPFPEGCSLVVVNSGEQARKTAGARDAFNQRVACYHLARELLKRRHPEHGAAIEHLRDVNAGRLGLPPGGVLRLAAALPQAATRPQLRRELPPAFCDRLFAGHAEPDQPYAVRGVALFGLAECERSRRCPDLLRAGMLEAFGAWMRTSHDGDRVSRCGTRAWQWDCGDAALARLAADPALDLADVPGAYACSTPRLDRMVDTALGVPGVLGAQMAGAGLGGCMMVLARDEAVDALRAAIDAACGPLEVLHARPVAGSGVLAA